jgi:hypothetical protein
MSELKRESSKLTQSFSNAKAAIVESQEKINELNKKLMNAKATSIEYRLIDKSLRDAAIWN